MSITVVDSGNTKQVRIGGLTRFEDYTGISTDGGRLYTVGANCMFTPRRDSMARVLQNSIYDFGRVNLAAALGLSFEDLVDNREISGHRPKNSDYNEQADGFHYASLLSDWASLLTPSHPSHARRRFARDHNVSHLNIKGRLIADLDEEWDYVRHPAFFHEDGRIYQGWNRTDTGVAGLDTWFTDKVSLSDPYLFGSYGFGPQVSFGAKMRAWTRDLVSQNPSFSVRIADQYGWQESHYEIVSVRMKSDFFSVLYTFKQLDRDVTLGKWGSAFWLIYHTQNLIETVPVRPEAPGDYWLSRLNVDRRITYQFTGGATWDGSSLHDFEERDPVTVLGPVVRPVVLAFSEGTKAQSPVEIHSDLLKDLDWFKGRVDVELSRRNLQPASFYSSADALTDHISTLKNNYIEVLSELPDVVGLLPDIKALCSVLIHARKGDLRTIRAIGDLYAAHLLKYNFGIRPTVEVVRELNRSTPAILKAFDRFIHPRTVKLQGKFNFDFPVGTFDTSAPTRMSVHSTLGVRYSDPAFSNWLGLTALGLAPGLSNIWEALPNSFIVDWHVNMSGRLAAIDNQLLFAMVAVDWSEHSYEVTLPLEGSHSVSGFLSDDARLVYYIRHLSRRVPSLRESKFDFQKAGTFRSISNALSLIWLKG